MNWNCHDHRNELRISDNNTIYHPDHGVLCWAEIHYDIIINHPITFKDKAAAGDWIQEGSIGQLQQGMSYLHIGFETDLVKNR